MSFDKEYELKNYNAAALLDAIDNTGVRVFMYYPQTKIITVPKNACEAYHCKAVYEDMPQSFADDFVHEDDHSAFNEMYYRIDRGEKTATAIFHSQDLNFCHHVTLTTVGWKENGEPEAAVGIIEDMSEAYKSKTLLQQLQNKISEDFQADATVQKAVQLIADTISGEYLTIYHIWLEDMTYVCFQDESTNYAISRGNRIPCVQEHANQYVDEFVKPEYASDLRKFYCFDTLKERLKDTSYVEMVYQTNRNGWTKARYIVAERDDDGNASNVIFTVKDINNDVVREEKKKKTEFELLHDPLTEAYNRKAFDEMEASENNNGKPTGFAIVDIDNFKIVNDAFGHEVGDKVLVEVAKLLKSALRPDDLVFRIGGDEFAVLLRNCKPSVWKPLCEKQRQIHAALNQLIDGTSVTLSIGIVFSSNGYNADVFHQADEQLYEVKHRGRAGAGMLDLATGQTNYWRDDALSYEAQNVLGFNNTGLYRIELPIDTSIAPRLICGEITRDMFGFPQDSSPEECYRLWMDNVDPSYLDALIQTRETVLNGQQAECTYLWNHPTLGKIFVRTGGSGEVVDGVRILHGYHHSMKNTIIVERQDDKQLLFDSMSAIYFCAYYIDLDNDSFATMKNAPGEKYLEISENKASDTMNQFLSSLVTDEDREKMIEFADLKTLPERLKNDIHLDCEYRSTTEKGWCRATFFPVKWDADGRLTHTLFVVTSLDEHKASEARKNAESRKSIESLYNNVLGGIVMYEWDGKKLRTVHLSAYYEKAYGYTLNNGEDGDRGPDYKYVHPDDLADYQKAIAIALSDTHELHYEFRRWNIAQKRYAWIHLDATSTVQPDGTSLVFALYTDVTDQKEVELNLAKRQASLETALEVSEQICCEYDPQTHIIECQNPDNYLKLPKVAENYPECMRDYNIIHPNDIELFMQTVHAFDGSKVESCTLRCLKNGEYRWFTCTFSPYYDQEKDRNIAILIVQDATHRMETMHSYEDRLRSLLATNKNALSICTINVSQNTFEMLGVDNTMKQFVDEKASFETVMLSAADSIIGEEAQKAYRDLFCRENLLKQAAEGNMHLQMEYLFNVSEKHYEWITATVDLIRNPITEDIVGVAYSNVTGTQRMKSALLDKSLQQDYLFAAIIFTDTDEFYLYDPIQKKFGEHMTDYWDVAIKDAKPRCPQKTYQYLEEMVSKERVLNQLETDPDYSFSYDSSFGGQDIRLEIRYSYADEAKTMILASMRNITDFVLLERFRYDSEHDPLTGLYNRNTTFRKCREMLDAHPDDQFVMVHADVRHFRLYNTFFGEAAGDQLLCDAADLFRWMDADYDYWVYGRIDADVLCAFFPYNQARYRKHISKAIDVLKNYRGDYLVEPVVGMYFVTDPSMPIDAMFTRATLAAKTVKPETQYATVVYDEILEQKLTEEQQILNDMQAAINAEQFEVYLQPKYSLRTNKPVGAEALVRWMHPKKGMISPGTFIPVFESNGFITTLDRYMWKKVCCLLSNWKKEGKPLAPVSVNVSRLSMFGSTTVDFLKDLVNKYDIEPKYLELELTESAYMDDPEEMQIQMQALKDAGFTILLDDFGSGYSSLNTLRDIPVDVLKLDMKFLSMDQNDVRGGLVISSIIRMAKLLKLVVVAEGVETQEQADYLRGVGCEYVQGFLFSRPVPVADYEKILADGSKPLEHVNEATMEHIGRILAETGSGTYAMGTVIPTPLACVEYVDHQFTFSRVNPAFFTEFDASENNENMSRVFKNHLTEQSYSYLTQAFDRSIQSGAKVRVPIMWKADDGKLRTYICSVMYEGNIGATATMVITFINVTDMIKADDVETEQKNSIETDSRLWNYVKTLVSANDINEVTNSILQEVLHYYNADRAYIFEFDWDQNIGINTYEMCAPDIEPMIDTLQDVPLDGFGAWINLFNKNSLIHIKDLNALIDDESRKDEYDILAAQEIQSLIATPVYYGKRLVGFLGVDNPKNNLDDTAFIESLAFFCVNVSLKEQGLCCSSCHE